MTNLDFNNCSRELFFNFILSTNFLELKRFDFLSWLSSSISILRFFFEPFIFFCYSNLNFCFISLSIVHLVPFAISNFYMFQWTQLATILFAIMLLLDFVCLQRIWTVDNVKYEGRKILRKRNFIFKKRYNNLILLKLVLIWNVLYM